MLLLILFSLCITLVIPYFSYCSSVWDPSVSFTNAEILKKTQHFALKMCSHKWDNNYSSLLSTSNLPTLSTHRSISKLCLLYKITNNLLYFPSDIFICKPLPSYASHHFDPLTFTNPFSHSSASQNSFFPSVLSLWNSLPYHVKSSSFLITFKSKVNMLLY